MKSKISIFPCCVILFIVISGIFYQTASANKADIAKKDALSVATIETVQKNSSTIERGTNKVVSKEEVKNISPYIGMEEGNLLVCKWGRAETVNTITTANGSSKQFCYSGYRYVYVEKGVVTKIQGEDYK